ncbi:winged helix-turn-helix transcriptional regulator [Olivibacter domesticus]|uniref:Transcriptional regulator, HxlR family n=1 Tax=Olivibacter domesticus TaxID=407022 RepID=A0A1H7RD95_OLID1|nr:helix-turn-helix domain-containing protein [Olivibacter domesticus]SEL57928.1 transcriptional regulator, HxlR family [Olivibacter domesticus]
MGERKLNSTYTRNEQCIINCDLTYVIHIISGRWKLFILDLLSRKKYRFKEFKRKFSFLTDRVLTSQLRALEKDGLVKRTVYAEVPVRVEYELTDLAIELIPIFEQLSKWGKKQRELKGESGLSCARLSR